MGTFLEENLRLANQIRQLRDDERTLADVSEHLGLSVSRVSNLDRIVRLAKPEWLEWVNRRRLSLKHVEAVLKLPEAQADHLLRSAMSRKWSYLTLCDEVRYARGAPRPDEPHPDADIAHLEARLSEVFSAPVKIRQKKGGAGELVLGFTCNDTLQGLLDTMKVQLD